MKKLIALLTAAAVTMVLTSCALTGATSRTGYAYIHMTKEAGEVTGHTDMSKSGKACTQNILGVIAMGDSTLQDAMDDGDITKVATVDYQYTNFLGFYGEVCTLVTGS